MIVAISYFLIGAILTLPIVYHVARQEAKKYDGLDEGDFAAFTGISMLGIVLWPLAVLLSPIIGLVALADRNAKK